jgi:hypothetical protein
MFTGTPRDGFGFLDFHFHRSEFCPLMGSVTEGLFFGATTGAPVISAWFGFLNNWKLLKNNRIDHGFIWEFNK